MFKRLFQRKPIFVLTLAKETRLEEYNTIVNSLKNELGNEYKVVVIIDSHKVHHDTKLLK